MQNLLRSKSASRESLLREFCRQEWLDETEVELLFIKRAFTLNDRHSGQVAFPGGKVEPNESDHDACQRETLEEIGLDVTDTYQSSWNVVY